MQGEDTKLYAAFPPTTFAAAAGGAVQPAPNGPTGSSAAPPDLGAQPNGTADFEAIKRSFEGAGRAPTAPTGAAEGSVGATAPGPPGGGAGGLAGAHPPVPPYQDVYAPAAGISPNGMYGPPFAAHPPPPFVPGQAQQASTSNGAMANGGAPPPPPPPGPQSVGGGFSAATSPFLGNAVPHMNGAGPAGGPVPLPFGSPIPPPAGHMAGGPVPLSHPHPQPYAGSAFDPTPASPNPYGGPPPPGGAPFGSPAPGAFGGLGIGSPFLGMGMSPMLGMGSPQMGGGAFPNMPYPIGGGGGGAQPMGGMGATQTPSTRTVYVGNLPSDASVDELLSQVRFGPIESIRILPEKSCAFISFLDPNTAAAFHSDALMRKVRLHDHDLKIGWGKPSAVSANVLAAVQQSGATRNVYLGNLDEQVTEQTLRDDLSRFGPIDQVKIVRDKNIGFVHFLSIATAIKVVQNLPQEPGWVGRRVAYGKDRTAYVPKNQHQQQQHNMAAAAMGSMAATYGGFGGLGFGSPNMGFGQNGDPNAQPGNRTIYLGNIHPEVTTEEICNIIRGGILQQIRYIPDKHICFVTFVDPHCALAFYQTASFQGIALHNRRLKVGWGKQSGPTSPGIAMVVQAGGSRNVYVGNIEDFETYDEDKLRKDFGEYGEIELINFLKEKQCCFVNFTNITNAIKAIEGIKQHPDYAKLKISYGKDRCGGAPRQFRGFDLRNQQRPSHQQQQQQQQQQQGQQGQGNGDSNGGGAFPRSPFTDPLSFPTTPLQADQLHLAEGDEAASPHLPEIGALVLDEEAAAAATGGQQTSQA